jgi:hypothetical protein
MLDMRFQSITEAHFSRLRPVRSFGPLAFLLLQIGKPE